MELFCILPKARLKEKVDFMKMVLPEKMKSIRCSYNRRKREERDVLLTKMGSGSRPGMTCVDCGKPDK